MSQRESATVHHNVTNVRGDHVRAEYPPPHHAQRWVDSQTDLAQRAHQPRAEVGHHAVSLGQESSPMLDAQPTPVTIPAAPTAVSLQSSPRLEKSAPPTQADAPYRVLIVEDDRSQALFAQSVLNGAGIQARVETSAAAVSQAINDYQPDLVLMDLHMPELDGIRLTALIRQQPGRNLLPIVFLTGDPDPEKEFELLENGADDVLTKPIRPRHLIAAVSNRIRRIRQQTLLSQGDVKAVDNNPETGLPTRDFLLRELDQLIKDRAEGGILLIEIAGMLSLHERYGYATFERLMNQTEIKLAAMTKPHPVARLSENSFLILAKHTSENERMALAQRARLQLASQAIAVREEEAASLRSAIGHAAFNAGFHSFADAIHAVEQATLRARLHPEGIVAYTAHEQSSLPGAHSGQPQPFDDCQLELAYQPIVAVKGGKTAQYQVLLRMRQPDGTLLSAAQIIPAAQASGRIVDFDQQVLDHTLGLLEQHIHATSPLHLFVSLSVETLMREDVIEWLLTSLDKRKLPGESLIVDIRLDDVIEKATTLQHISSHLAPHGIRLCLSQFDHTTPDFLTLLDELPMDFIRLSQRYNEVHSDISLRQQLIDLIAQVHKRGLLVIAQRIEDTQAAASMWMSGADFIQGNLVKSVGSELDFNFNHAIL